MGATGQSLFFCFEHTLNVIQLLQRFLSSGYSSGCQDTRRCDSIRDRPARGTVRTSSQNGHGTHCTNRHEATPEIWQETYVSAILRAVLYSDDPTYWLDAYRKLDPITSPEGELRFLQAAEALFPKGMCFSRLMVRRNSNGNQVGKWAQIPKFRLPQLSLIILPLVS